MRQLSLLDTAYQHVIDMWVVFRDLPDRQAWLWSVLKPGFQHVECWQYVPPGAWLRFDTCLEFVSVEVYAHPPWEFFDVSLNPTVMRVQRTAPHGVIRQPFYVGPVTCVTLSAAMLGVRLPFMCRTPYQFYRYLQREQNVA